jgi:hypothetical protein
MNGLFLLRKINIMDDKKIKIEFAPGCFDNFEGTQEELDELVAEITRMVESGEMLEEGSAVDIDSMMEEDPELAAALMRQLDLLEDEQTDAGRILN